MSKKEILDKLSANRDEIESYSVKKIGLFGSQVKGTSRKGSDIDILVEFKQKSFDNYMDLKFFLEKLLKSKVDLVLTEALKP